MVQLLSCGLRLYHWTPNESVAAILERGFDNGAEGFVWFCTEPESLHGAEIREMSCFAVDFPDEVLAELFERDCTASVPGASDWGIPLEVANRYLSALP